MGIPAKLEAPAQNGAFIALVFLIFGWVLIETWLFALGASIIVHALVAVWSIPLVAIAARRYRMHWPAISSELRLPKARKLFDAGWFILLLVIGYMLGQLLLAGWMLQLSIFTIALTFVPWSRIPVCRKYFLASGLVVGGAAAYPLFVNSAIAGSISMLTGAWVLIMSACFSLLLRR